MLKDCISPTLDDMPLSDKLPDRVLDTYIKCINAKDVLYYPSEVTRENNELRVSELALTGSDRGIELG